MRLAELSGRRVGLWGFGREGRAAMEALLRLAPAPVEITIVTDTEPSEGDRVTAAGHRWLHGVDGTAALQRVDVVIRSPGISIYRRDAREVGAATTVTTGTNLWFAEHADDAVVAVTGSKGKSTTSSLIAHLARAAGRTTILAGNIGVPLLGHLHPHPSPDLWVLELSSQQISDLAYSPRVGVLLNLYREHIDWHGSQDRYVRDKLNLFGHRDDGVAVLNRKDEATAGVSGGLDHVVWFGGPEGYHSDGRRVLWRRQALIDSDQLLVKGPHNLLNICAALTAVEQLGIDARRHAGDLTGFSPLRHRLEPVGEVDGVTYVNDSIATVPESAVAALDTWPDRPVVLIAGGFDREQDYTPLVARLREAANVLAVITLPASGRRLAAALDATAGTPPVSAADDLAGALARARALSHPGTVVLLSPAAPSYGVFRDFEERGDAFRRLVAAMSGASSPEPSPGAPGSRGAGA